MKRQLTTILIAILTFALLNCPGLAEKASASDDVSVQAASALSGRQAA